MEYKDLSVLICDGDHERAVALRKLLRDMGFFHVDVGCDGFVALTHLKSHNYSLLLLDEALPKIEAVSLVAKMRRIPRFTPPKCVILLKEADRDVILAASREGVKDFLLRPVTPHALASRLDKMLKS